MATRQETGFRWATSHGLSLETYKVPAWIPFLRHIRWAGQKIPTGATIADLHFTPGGLDFAHEDISAYALYHLYASINEARKLFQRLEAQGKKSLIPTYLVGFTNREMAQAAEKLGFQRRGRGVAIKTQDFLTNPRLGEKHTRAFMARLAGKEHAQGEKVAGIIEQRRQEKNVFQRLLPYVSVMTGGSFLLSGLGGASAVGALGLSTAAGAEAIHRGYKALTAHSVPENDAVFIPKYHVSPFQRVKEFAIKFISKFQKNK